MSFASRGTRTVARSLRTTRASQVGRRHASDSHGHGHDHGHGESALHLKSANTTGNESLGPGIFIALGAVPLFYIGYSLAYGSEDNYFARLYLKYKEGAKASGDREFLHTAILAEAIGDRARLSSYPRDTAGPELKYPEQFNQSSPWNQAAGQGGANMEELVAHYRRVQGEVEQERSARIQNGKVKSIYD